MNHSFIEVNPLLVILSILTAAFSSLVTYDLLQRAAETNGKSKKLWTLGSSFVMGLGIWNIHFIAMFAYHIRLSLQVNNWIILCSIIFMTVFSYIGIGVIHLDAQSKKNLFLGGGMIGIGLIFMHLMAFSAIAASIDIGSLYVFLFSGIFISISAATLTLLDAVKMERPERGGSIRKMASGFLLAAAIWVIHFVGGHLFNWYEVRPDSLYQKGDVVELTTVLFICFMINGLFLACSTIDRRLTRKNEQLKRYADEIKDSEQRYRSLVEISSSVISVIQDNEVVYLNARGFELMGVKNMEDLTGKCFLESMQEPDRAQFLTRITGLANRNTNEYLEITITSCNGHPMQMELSAKWINYSGKPAILTVSRDVSERRKQQQQLEESEERYRMLQESFNHFSKDLFKVMEPSDLEKRLMEEIAQVFKIEDTFIMEMDQQLNFYRSTGGSEEFHEIMLKNFRSADIGELVWTERGAYVKIGEPNNRMILLCSENRQIQSQLQAPHRIWLQTISRYISVLYENLFTIEDLAKELENYSNGNAASKWVLRLLFHVAEKERIRLSADLHDSVLQNLIFHYRKIQSLCMDSILPEELTQELRQVEAGLLEGIHQIRVTCNHLRPPYLNEQGIIKAMESLIGYTEKQVTFMIEFDFEGLKFLPNEEGTIALYRVAQELLANAQKHSNATKVEFTLSSMEDTIYFMYQDNGVGFNPDTQDYSFEQIGLSGMKKRVDSVGGDMELYSLPGKGVNVLVTVPADRQQPRPIPLLEAFQ
ncbi:PAS domain S-box protein [Neobacillus muris]|uniref:PAS domain S-box protein n=1 Tax=Neobacillus muris TaxID=2941334 RepID=UPI00203BA534|nr:PAS domain S-box protein [Neobacillus muris]